MSANPYLDALKGFICLHGLPLAAHCEACDAWANEWTDLAAIRGELWLNNPLTADQGKALLRTVDELTEEMQKETDACYELRTERNELRAKLAEAEQALQRMMKDRDEYFERAQAAEAKLAEAENRPRALS